jgi:hypothetical protein
MAKKPEHLPDVMTLLTLDIRTLKAAWRAAFKSPVPNVARKEFFVRILAYETQRRVYGDLSKAALKTLRDVAGGSPDAPTIERLIGPGTRLIREWGGSTHEVTVTDQGYAYRGRTYASLSEIARSITGARWSGPRFFGLRSHERSATARPA